MAELVDALASGASSLTAVKVRVLSWAPKVSFSWEPERDGELKIGRWNEARPIIPLAPDDAAALNSANLNGGWQSFWQRRFSVELTL